MAAQTFSAHAVAREASKVAGRTVTDKQVRGLARETMARFDKDANPAYQSHAYTARERDALVAVFAARAGKRSGKRSSTRKAATVTRKAQRSRKVAAQVAPEAAPDA